MIPLPRLSGLATVMVALGCSALLGGCASGGAQDGPFGQGASADGITLYVTNMAFSDATLYGVTIGARQRLGRVVGNDEAVFTMRLAFPTEVYLEIDFLAGPTCVTDRFPVDPGDELELTIQSDFVNLRCRAP